MLKLLSRFIFWLTGWKVVGNVPEEVKKRRLTEIVALQLKHSANRTKQFVGETVEVLIEKESKKSDTDWSGRTEHNTVAVFPKKHYTIGDFVLVAIEDCTGATLIGAAVEYAEKR